MRWQLAWGLSWLESYMTHIYHKQLLLSPDFQQQQWQRNVVTREGRKSRGRCQLWSVNLLHCMGLRKSSPYLIPSFLIYKTWRSTPLSQGCWKHRKRCKQGTHLECLQHSLCMMMEVPRIMCVFRFASIYCLSFSILNELREEFKYQMINIPRAPHILPFGDNCQTLVINMLLTRTCDATWPCRKQLSA